MDTSGEIGQKEFARKLKGFDETEVRLYLKHLGGEFAKLDEQIKEARTRAIAAEDQLMLIEQQSTDEGKYNNLSEHVDDLLKGAQGVREDIRKRAESEAATIVTESEHDANRIRTEAERAAVELKTESEKQMRDTEAHIAQQLDEARKQAEAIVTDAKTHADELTETAQKNLARDRDKSLVEAEKTIADTQAKVDQMMSEAESSAADVSTDATAKAEILVNDAQARAESIITAADANAKARNEELAMIDARLKEADEYLSTTQAEADGYSAARREEADTYFKSKSDEADGYFQSKLVEADGYFDTKRQEADALVVERQEGILEEAKEAEEARDKALSEIDDAKGQVAELLERARSQSEFLRQEAEEVIREKVRNYIEQSEKRIARLHITEQSAKERLISAQKELSSALENVTVDDREELGEGTDESVLAEAEKRMLAAVEVDIRDEQANPVVIDMDAESHTPAAGYRDLPEVQPDSNDPLSQLVREAMQQAVDTASSSESSIKSAE